MHKFNKDEVAHRKPFGVSPLSGICTIVCLSHPVTPESWVKWLLIVCVQHVLISSPTQAMAEVYLPTHCTFLLQVFSKCYVKNDLLSLLFVFPYFSLQTHCYFLSTERVCDCVGLLIVFCKCVFAHKLLYVLWH